MGRKKDPTVLVTNMELLGILAGREHQIAVEGGGHVLVRLATPEELIAAQRAANKKLGGPLMPLPLDKAMELCRPFDVAALVRGRP